MVNNYPTESGDIYVLDDRKELGYNLDGVNYSLHPSQWYTAGEPIVKGSAISIASQAWAVAEGLVAGDAGKAFNSEQSNTDKCVGISLNGAIYGEQVEVLDHGFYSWTTNSLLITAITNSGAGSLLINGVLLAVSGASSALVAASLVTAFNASLLANPLGALKGYTLTNPSGAIVEIAVDKTKVPLTNVPTIAAGATTTFSTPFYANRTTTTVLGTSELANTTVLINGVSYTIVSAPANPTAMATAIAALVVPGYTMTNPSAGVVSITTTLSNGVIPTIYVGGSSPFLNTTLSSKYQYTVFQPTDIGNTLYVLSLPTDTLPTTVSFLVQSTAPESGANFVLNATTSSSTITGSGTDTLPTTTGSTSALVATSIAAVTPIAGFTITNPSNGVVTITGKAVSNIITNIGLGTLAHTILTPIFSDAFPSLQMTTNRSLAVASGATLIEVGLVKDLNIVFIDFEGDTRGAVNLSQITTTAGEPLPNNGTPTVVSIGIDTPTGLAYLADRRKGNVGAANQNRNNAAGFLVGANSGFSSLQTNTLSGVQGAGALVVTNPINAGVPQTGLISVTHATIVYSYSYGSWAGSTYSSVVVIGSSPATNLLTGGDYVWGGTIPVGTPVVIQKAGVIPGFTGLSVGVAVYADYNGAINQNINTFSFYTDVVTPLGFAMTQTSVYVEAGFNTQKTDTGTIGSQYQMLAAVSDYGSLPCITNGSGGLVVTGNAAGQAGHLNAVGLSTITAGTGVPTNVVSTPTDFTSLYATIGTSYGGYSVWVITNFSAASGQAMLNGVNYAIGVPASNNDLAAKIAAAIGTVGTYVCTNPSANFVAITNDSTHTPPIFSINVGTAIATPSTVNGGNTGTTFALPNLFAATPKFQIRYINNFIYNPPTAPFFRWDSGWTAWGSLPLGIVTGTASQYMEIPTTQFGTDIAATDVFAELYVTDTATPGTIRQINPNPINDGAGHSYGYSLSKDTPNFLRIDFAASGLAYNTFGGGFINITTLTNPTYRIYLYKIEKYNKFYNHTGDTQLAQLWLENFVDLVTDPTTTQSSAHFDRTVTAPVHTIRLNYDGDFFATDITSSNNFTVSNTSGTGISTINAATILLRGTTSTTIGVATVVTFDNAGNYSSPGNITLTGSGALSVGGTSLFTGIATHNNNVIIQSTGTLSVGSAAQLSVSAVGTLTTTGNISTTGSGTLSIAGLATFNANVNIPGASASLDDLTGASTFTLLATPTIVNIGNTGASTLTLRNPTLVMSATSATMTNGTMTFGDATHAGVLTFSDATATTGNWSTITNASPSLTLNQKDASSSIYFFTSDATPTNAERFRVSFNEIKISNIPLTSASWTNGNTTSSLHIFSPAASVAASIMFDINGTASKLTYDVTDRRFTFGGASDGTDGATVWAGVFNTTSTKKNKSNIQKFNEKATDLLSQIEVVTFNLKEDQKKETRIGFIAEDTHEYLSGVSHNKMDIANTLGLLIKAVQELVNDVSEMKGKAIWQS